MSTVGKKRKCKCCGRKPNAACSCPAGTLGGLIDSCGGKYRTWPVALSATMATTGVAWQVEGHPLGAIYPPEYWDGTEIVDLRTEAGMTHWKGQTFETYGGTNSTLVLNVSFAVSGGVSLSGGEAIGCNVSGYGEKFKIRATNGDEYTFDTLTGSGLPIPQAVVEFVSFTARSDAYDQSSTSGFVDYYYERQDFVAAAFTNNSDCGFYSTHAGADAAGYVNIVFTVEPQASLLYHERKALGIETNNYYTPPHVSTGRSHTKQYSTIGFSGIALPKPTGGYWSTELGAVGEPNSGAVANVCLDSIASHDSFAYTAISPGVLLSGAFYRNVTLQNYTGSLGVVAPFKLTAATTTTDIPSNPGCIDCQRGYRIKVTQDWDDAVVIDEIVRQSCSQPYEVAGYVPGWPYACTWGGPTVTISKNGPLHWSISKGGTTYAGKGSGSCPTDITELKAFVTTPSDNPAYVSEVTGSGDEATINIVSHSGYTRLEVKTYTLEVTAVELETKTCCACDGDDPEDCIPPTPCEDGDCDDMSTAFVLYIELDDAGKEQYDADVPDNDGEYPYIAMTFTKVEGECRWHGISTHNDFDDVVLEGDVEIYPGGTAGQFEFVFYAADQLGAGMFANGNAPCDVDVANMQLTPGDWDMTGYSIQLTTG